MTSPQLPFSDRAAVSSVVLLELVESAREDAEFHSQEHPVVAAAHLQAERIVERSRHEADALMLSADQRVEQLFSQLEGQAVELAHQLRSTRPTARAAAGATQGEPG